jgi:hypothetical protein
MSLGKTYKPLYQYYVPSNYYTKTGYFSPTYSLTYYDGYGYNFYYGKYGYYEFSINDKEEFGAAAVGGSGETSLAGIIIFSILAFYIVGVMPATFLFVNTNPDEG